MSSTVTGTVKVEDDGITKTLIVKDTPDKAFTNPPERFWDLVKGNAGVAITVTYDPGVVPAPDTVTKVSVG